MYEYMHWYTNIISIVGRCPEMVSVENSRDSRGVMRTLRSDFDLLPDRDLVTKTPALPHPALAPTACSLRPPTAPWRPRLATVVSPPSPNRFYKAHRASARGCARAVIL